MKTPTALLIVSFVAVLSWWLLSSEQERHHTKTDDKRFINMFINHFTLTTTDTSGEIAYILKADRLEHYNNEQLSHVFNPIIQLPQDGSNWLISAKFGDINNRQNLITLHDDVKMTQTDSTKTFIITTDAMTINTISKVIDSKQLVTMQNGFLKLKSNGMHFDGLKQTLTLLPDVSGIYATQ